MSEELDTVEVCGVPFLAPIPTMNEYQLRQLQQMIEDFGPRLYPKRVYGEVAPEYVETFSQRLRDLQELVDLGLVAVGEDTGNDDVRLLRVTERGRFFFDDNYAITTRPQ